MPSLCYGVISGQQTLHWRSLAALSLPNIPTKTFRKIGKSQMNQLETAHREASILLISSVKCPRIFFGIMIYLVRMCSEIRLIINKLAQIFVRRKLQHLTSMKLVFLGCAREVFQTANCIRRVRALAQHIFFVN